MGIYIKGMEMPSIDLEWRVIRGQDGKWYAIDVNAETSDGEWHEIVSVPPHGRLGDLDELYAHLNEWYLTNNPVFTKEEALYIRAMLLGIVEAPTIIPAEGGET